MSGMKCQRSPHRSRQSTRCISKRSTSHLTLLLVLCFALLLHPHVPSVSALKATFTPEPDKDTGSTDGPLPASQNQRDSLSEMDRLIASSSNPTEMLQKIADGNGIPAAELGDMLMRNRRDMDMANEGGGGAHAGLDTIPKRMINVLSSLALVAAKSASAHPRSFTLLALLLLAALSVIICAPRNGAVLSTQRGLLSGGHTTIWAPPTKYLSKFVESDGFRRKESGTDAEAGVLARMFADGDAGEGDENGVLVENLSKRQKKHLKFVVTAKKNIPFEVLLPSDEDMEFDCEKESGGEGAEDKENTMQKIEEKAWDEAMTLAYTSAENILTSRRFTEYVPSPPNQLRLFSPIKSGSHRSGDEGAALIFKSMGDWRRFGVQPLRVAYEENAADTRSVVYHTLAGGHFDGELRITVKKIGDSEEEESNISVTVTMLVPKNGRKINSKVASKMVLFLAESTAASIITGAKQILSRKQQSSLYRGRAKTKASDKRHIAYENLKLMEEMAQDRRRRWQRSNQNSGRFTPSRDMMKSPGGGGPSYGF